VVTSATAARAADSSTMLLSAANAHSPPIGRPPGPGHTAAAVSAVSIALPGGSASAAVAREFVGLLLRSWRLNECNGDVLLLASELVSNAVLHGGGAAAMTVERTDQVLRIAVADRSTAAPRPRRPDVDGGFGLGLVHRLSQRWGTEPTADGKVVWLEYRLP
ncbi:ATP-binding protein, partial [Catellatospora sp. NPDC049609]|uniref:ATP-binding protein n=1 Tax=Catellatospora sp. NPDC049609 TaxID=3155505 RepID=UPI003436CE2D